MKKILFLALAVTLLLAATAGAQEEYFGKNKVQYKNFHWKYIQSPNFDVYFYGDDYDLAKFSITELESAYVYVSDQLDYRLRGRIPVFVYNSPNEFQQTNVVPDILPESVGGFTESFKNRVVVPFNGSYEDLRHVLHHELTHAMIYDMLYGGGFGSLVSRQYLFRLPLWFAEGYAEYSSRYGWDYEADMVMRDATIHSYLQPLEYLGGYLAYKEGQAAVKFLAETYGEEKIRDVINKGRRSLSMEKALKSSIGLTEKQFYDKFQLWLKKMYWPEIATRQEPSTIGKRLTDHEKDRSYFNEKPVFSPDGKKIAYFSDKSDYTQIYVMSAIDGKNLKTLAKSERSGDLESLHSFVSGISWSPDGKELVFVAKSSGEDALFIYDYDKGHVIEKLKFGFNSVLNPSWGTDNRIVFTGVKNSKADLYIVDPDTRKLRRMMNDYYDDNQAAFSHDGKFIAFSSDRPLTPDKGDKFSYGVYNIYIMDANSGAIVDTVTHQKGICHYPTWSPDDTKLCYVSNLNGIDNLYIKKLHDKSSAYPITNVLTGISAPSWSPDGDKIVFQTFYKAGYDIYMMSDIKPVTVNSAPLADTKFFKGEMVATYAAAGAQGTSDTTGAMASSDSTGNKAAEDTLSGSNDYVFTPAPRSTYALKDTTGQNQSEPESDGRDTLYTKTPEGEYKVKKYTPKFTPDVVSGGLSYDAFYGLRGQSFIVISDYLGNHNFYISTDVVNSVNQSNLQVFYLNTGHRTDYGVGIFHNKNYFQDNHSRLFSDRTYGALASFSHPFSMYRRVQLDLTQLYVDRTYYDARFDAAQGKYVYDDGSENATLADLSLINDTVLWGLTGPINGNRWKLNLERSIPISSQGQDYWAAEFDYRRYWHLGGLYSFAVRAAGGVSTGANKKRYYMGGSTNYIGSVHAGDDVYSINGFYFSKIVTPLRGYDYFALQGSHFGLVNLELRYPFVDYFAMHFPLPLVISHLTGAMFFDAGAAWDENELFKLGTSQGGSQHLLGLKTGFGAGARVNLGIFLLRYDLAWGWDLDRATKPHHYFSFGAEF